VARLEGNNAKDEVLVLADVAEKAITEIQSLIVKLLEDKIGADKAREVARLLTEGNYTHDYPITVEEARKLGLNVKTDVLPEVYVLMKLYPQALQQKTEG